jgi:maltose alpha-D-glucosyltransferase / alpha-amylase
VFCDIVLHNLGDRLCSTRVDLDDGELCHLTDLFGDRIYEPNTRGASLFELEGSGYRWFRIDSL